MTKEELTKLGLSDDLVKAVKALFDKELDGNYVPKEKFNAELQKVKDKDAQLSEREKQIAELGKFKGNAEELTKKIEELQAKNEASTKEYQEKLKQLELSSALKLALADQVFEVSDVIGKIDASKLTIEDGVVKAGLDDQLKTLKEQHPHYFKGDPKNGWKPFGNNPKQGGKGEEDNYEEFAKDLAKNAATANPIQEQVDKEYFK